MPTYTFSCPICHKPYRLTPKNPASLSQKSFTCLSCRYTAPFSTVIKELSATQPATFSESPQKPIMQHAATKVSKREDTLSKVYLTVMNTKARFVLNQGIYILGRKSSDSTATLQLAPDISISRQHARLAVQMVGGRTMAQVIGLKSNNPIYVNGKMYMAGQPCTLKSGDKLQLGMTTVLFSV